ncbi:MAG: hypothetical protein K8F59_13750 [Rhodobacteraceae bacterium]|nr:hypothetical protein [Paracoccaceae bacterium]
MTTITTAFFESQFPVAVSGFRVNPPKGRCRAARISSCFAPAGELPPMRNGLDAILLPAFMLVPPEDDEWAENLDSGDYLNGGGGDDLTLRSRDMAPFAWA